MDRWTRTLNEGVQAVADFDVYGHSRARRGGRVGVDCGEADRATPMVSWFVQDDRGEHCVCGVGDSVCMGSACVWGHGAVLGTHVD